MELLTEDENVLHIHEIAASETYESELKMLSGGVSFQLFGYINIISAPRLWRLPAPLRSLAPLRWGGSIDFSKTFMLFLQLAGVPF